MPQVDPVHAQAARTPLRTFLKSLVAQPDVHEAVVTMWAQKFGRKRSTCGQKIWRLLSDEEKFPTIETVEELSIAMTESQKIQWMALPVMYYASGYVCELVACVAGVNLVRISPSRLAEVLRAIPAAMAGDPDAQKALLLKGSEREAFPRSAEAAGRLMGRSLVSPDLDIAYALSGHHEVGLELLRERVLELLIKWADDAAMKVHIHRKARAS